MSKLQLLYEKIMRISYMFGGVFFLLTLIDFTVAMMTGAFSCSSGTCGVGDEHPFFQFTLLPLIIMTVIFFIVGYVFFRLAHKESDLLSVSDYKKSLENTTDSDEVISREELYEKLKRGNRKQKVQQQSFFKGISTSVSNFFEKKREQKRVAKENHEKLTAAEKLAAQEAMKIEEQRIETEKVERSRTKLNKTGLILLISQKTDLTQTNARLFVNTLLDVVKDTVIANDEVQIDDFGLFKKVFIEAHTEVDSDTNKEVNIEAHNSVEFYAYASLLQKLNINQEVVEELPVDAVSSVEEIVSDELVVEEATDEIIPSSAKTIEKDSEVVNDAVSEVEQITEEQITEQEVTEQTETFVKEEKEEVHSIEEQQVIVETHEEPQVVEETTDQEQEEESDEEDEVEDIKEKPTKASKIVESVRTKKQIIEMMDETTDLSKNKANKFLKYFAEVVKEQLMKREDVELEGIGYFTTIEMPAKEAVNPQTNEKIIVPAHHQVRLRFDEELKDKMNEPN